jgi:hypothetical protein
MIRTDDLQGQYDQAAAELLAAGERFETTVVALVSELVHRAAPVAARIDLDVAGGPDGEIYVLRGVRDGVGRTLPADALEPVRGLLARLLADLGAVAGTELRTLVLDPAGTPR